MIPLKYNLRNLRVRWATTLMTVLGTALVVWSIVLAFGLVDGLKHALRVSGEPLDLVVLRKGANDETSSTIDPQTARDIATLDGLAVAADGTPLCSAEFVTILTKPRRGAGGTTNLIVRGLPQNGRALRPAFQIVEGRDLKPGLNEVITSRQMARRFQNLALGERLDINKVQFQIVGYFEAGGSSAESEVWADARDLTSARRQQGAISVVNLRAADARAKQSLTERLRDDEQFKLNPIDETTYFEKQMTASLAISIVGNVIGFFLTFGAMFAAANTMYAAIASRGREIGTLRAIGFRRYTILTSFLLESVIICLMGGVLGCLATLPFNGLSTGTANWATFSEITFAFRLDPWLLARGVLLAIGMGLLGGFFPALYATRLRIVDALRQT
jgi:putative ABC transport system permease protein